jgi:hypothetical protein
MAKKGGCSLGFEASHQVPPGQGRIEACMKEYLPELSEPCKEGLFQPWLKL